MNGVRKTENALSSSIHEISTAWKRAHNLPRVRGLDELPFCEPYRFYLFIYSLVYLINSWNNSPHQDTTTSKLNSCMRVLAFVADVSRMFVRHSRRDWNLILQKTKLFASLPKSNVDVPKRNSAGNLRAISAAVSFTYVSSNDSVSSLRSYARPAISCLCLSLRRRSLTVLLAT